MSGAQFERNQLALGVERFGIAARYAVYGVLAPLFMLGYFKGGVTNFVLLSVVFAAHNLYGHVALLTKRFDWFYGKTNFAIYFFEANLVVYLTGGEVSDGYILYHLAIIGFSVYKREFRSVMIVTGMFVLSYALIITNNGFRIGLSIPIGVIVVKLISILVCGWLVGVVAQLLGDAESTAASQAQNLRSSEATLRTILDSTGDPILVIDDNEFITEANQQAAVFLGLEREQLLGQRFRAYLFDDGTLPHKFANMRARGEARGEEIVVDAHGEEHAVDVIARLFMRDQKRFYVAVLRDLTEHKNLAETTQLATQRLERLSAELRQFDRLKTGFLTAVSQRLRSPLSAVTGYVEMLLEEELGDVNTDQRKALQACRRSLIRVFKVIDESLELRHLDTRRSEPASLLRKTDDESHQ